jgi:hypothetical protein
MNFLASARHNYTITTQLQNSKPIVPPAMARLFAGEFKGIFSDFMTIEAASAIGSYLIRKDIRLKDLPAQAWDIIYELAATSQSLDPYFKDNYQLVGSFFPWEANRAKQAVDFLKIGADARYWDPLPPYNIGFIYFYFLNDNIQASKFLQESYKRGGGTIMATLSAKLLQKSGKTEIAIAYLENILKDEGNKQNLKSIQMRLTALKGVLVLEKAIVEYYKKHKEPLTDLQVLINEGIITQIPENSYNIPYCIDMATGNILFDSDKCLNPPTK